MSQPMTLTTEDFIPTRYSLLSRLQNWDDQDSWKEFFDIYWRLIYAVALFRVGALIKKEICRLETREIQLE